MRMPSWRMRKGEKKKKKAKKRREASETWPPAPPLYSIPPHPRAPERRAAAERRGARHTPSPPPRGLPRLPSRGNSRSWRGAGEPSASTSLPPFPSPTPWTPTQKSPELRSSSRGPHLLKPSTRGIDPSSPASESEWTPPS